MFKGWVILIAIAICCTYGANGQSLRGKPIYVSSSQTVKLKFGSRITNYNFIDRGQEGLFRIHSSGKNLSISSSAANFRTANLVITEGSNTHLFMLENKEQLSSDEGFYDLSSTEKLTAEIQKLKMVLNNSTARESFGKQTVSTPVFSAEDPAASGTTGNASTVETNHTEPANQQTAITASNTTPNSKPAPNNKKDSIAVTKIATNPTAGSAGNAGNMQSVKLATEVKNASKVETPTSKPEVKSAPKPAPPNVSKTLATNNSAPPLAKSNPVVTEPHPAPTEININEGYELLIHLGDSTAWIAKDFKGALHWYDSARKVNPVANYPRKQIAAVKQLINEQVAADTRERSARFRIALDDYKAADALRVDRKFEEAYKGYSKFLSQLDSARLNEYLGSELYYINQAKDYLVRLEPYMPRSKPVAAPAATEDKTKKKKRKKIF